MHMQGWAILAVIAVVVSLAVVVSRRDRAPKAKPSPPRSTDLVQMDREIAEYVDRAVREGFQSTAEIVQSVTEVVGDEYEAADLRIRVERETARRIEEHLAAQATWPEQTDCDRIDAAFAALEAKGIVARQDFTCCQTCGHAEIGDEIDAFAKKAKAVGYIFYHRQDTESACENGTLYLAYGSVTDSKEDAVKVGETVRDALQQHGLNVVWNGQLKTRICVTGLDWQKRRNRE